MKLIISGDTKLTSVVGQNEMLQKELGHAYRKIDQLRSTPCDPFTRLKDKKTNEYMLGKPAAKKPPNVLVTAGEIIRLNEDIKSGTCFLPKLDEDELLCGYQNDKNKEAKEQKILKAAEAARKREADAHAAKAAAHLAA